MRRKILKALALRMALLLTSLVITLLVLEIVVRILAPQQLIIRRPDMYRPDSNGFGWKHQANVNTTVNTGEGKVHFYTNEKGFRMGSANAPLRSPDYKVLALGDSFLEALQVEYEETMLAVIERELAARSGLDVEVVNTGVSDWDPNQYLMQAKEELATGEYDLALVFLYSPNDIISKYVEAYPPRNPSKRVLRWSLSQGPKQLASNLFYVVDDFLEERSHLYMFTKNAGEVIRAKVGHSRYTFPVWYELAYADSPAWATTADISARIADEAARYDVPIVFVHLPDQFGVDPEMLDQYIDDFNLDPATIDVDQISRLLKQEFDARGLTLLDAIVPLRAAYEADAGRLYGKIDIHLSELGHEVVGEYIVDWLVNNTEVAP